MKKIFLAILFLTTFFVVNAQNGLSLSIQNGATYTTASGQLFCLTDNITSQYFQFTITRQPSEIFYGNLYLVFKNGTLKNEVMITSISDANFSSGGTTYSSTWYQQLSNNSDGVVGINGTFANGTAYLVFRNSTTQNEISSGSYFTFQRNPLSVPATTSYCPSSPVAPASITATGCTSYSWSPATGLNTTTGATVQASAVATYTVTGTINGCATSKTVSVTKKNDLTVAPPSTTTCPNQATTLTASGSATYSWSPATGLNTTTGATVISTPSSTITYTVTGIKNGCSMEKTVTVNTLTPCGSTLANAINLGTFNSCTSGVSALYNNSTSNNYGNDYGINKTNGQPSDDIYFKINYDGYPGFPNFKENLMVDTRDGSNTNFNTYIHFLDANGNWLVSGETALNWVISAGIYYIVVEGKANASGNFNLFIYNTSNCSGDRIGSDNTNTEHFFSISPNPATDQINITLPSSDAAGEITFYTMEGATAKTVSTQTQTNNISIADLTSGFYLVKIKQGDFTKTEKIIIQ